MLLNIGIGGVRLVLVRNRSFDQTLPAGRESRPFCPDHPLRHVVAAAGDLPAHAHDPRAVGVLIFDGEVIEDIAVLGLGPDLTASHSGAFDGMGTDGPVDDIQVVDVLLDDMVARQPGVEQPVTDLPLHVRPFLCLVAHPVCHSRLNPESAHVPVALSGDDVSDIAVVDTFQNFQIVLLVTALGSRDNAQILFFSQFGAGDHRTDTGRIDGNRLFHKDVLSGFDGGFQVPGPEMRRGRHDDHVDVRRKNMFKGIKSLKHRVLCHGQIALGQLFLQTIVGLFQMIPEQIPHGRDHDIGGRFHTVNGRPCPAAAAADHPDPDAARLRPVQQSGSGNGGGQGGGRRNLDELTAGEARICCFIFHLYLLFRVNQKASQARYASMTAFSPSLPGLLLPCSMHRTPSYPLA